MRKASIMSFLFVFSMVISSLALAEEYRYRPYVLASSESGTAAQKLPQVRIALEQNGFEVVGDYTPYPGAHVLVVTNSAMKQAAAGSELGGYAAAVRVSVTESNEQVQVSYTSPGWMANVYRLSGDGEATADALKAALGSEKGFGSEGGRNRSNLRKYHYMMFMPYFDDQVVLAEFGSHSEAVAAVDKGLAAGQGGTSKVFQIDVPGKEESLIGVALADGEGADTTVMAATDKGELKHTAHLPYEVLVSGNKVYMLHGKFRIAQSFPDLTMGTFMKISGAPDAIEASMRAMVGN